MSLQTGKSSHLHICLSQETHVWFLSNPLLPCHLSTILISSSFGPLWQNMSAISHVHPYMDEHIKENYPHMDEHHFSVSKGHPLAEKK